MHCTCMSLGAMPFIECAYFRKRGDCYVVRSPFFYPLCHFSLKKLFDLLLIAILPNLIFKLIFTNNFPQFIISKT